MLELNEFSRFRNTPTLFRDNNLTFGKWTKPSWLLKRPADQFIGKFNVTAATEGKPDNIANVLYGSPQLYWVLLAFNNVTNPMRWPKAGTIIEYPLDVIVLPSLL